MSLIQNFLDSFEQNDITAQNATYQQLLDSFTNYNDNITEDYNRIYIDIIQSFYQHPQAVNALRWIENNFYQKLPYATPPFQASLYGVFVNSFDNSNSSILQDFILQKISSKHQEQSTTKFAYMFYEIVMAHTNHHNIYQAIEFLEHSFMRIFNQDNAHDIYYPIQSTILFSGLNNVKCMQYVYQREKSLGISPNIEHTIVTMLNTPNYEVLDFLFSIEEMNNFDPFKNIDAIVSNAEIKNIALYYNKFQDILHNNISAFIISLGMYNKLSSFLEIHELNKIDIANALSQKLHNKNYTYNRDNMQESYKINIIQLLEQEKDDNISRLNPLEHMDLIVAQDMDVEYILMFYKKFKKNIEQDFNEFTYLLRSSGKILDFIENADEVLSRQQIINMLLETSQSIVSTKYDLEKLHELYNNNMIDFLKYDEINTDFDASAHAEHVVWQMSVEDIALFYQKFQDTLNTKNFITFLQLYDKFFEFMKVAPHVLEDIDVLNEVLKLSTSVGYKDNIGQLYNKVNILFHENTQIFIQQLIHHNKLEKFMINSQNTCNDIDLLNILRYIISTHNSHNFHEKQYYYSTYCSTMSKFLAGTKDYSNLNKFDTVSHIMLVSKILNNDNIILLNEMSKKSLDINQFITILAKQNKLITFTQEIKDIFDNETIIAELSKSMNTEEQQPNLNIEDSYQYFAIIGNYCDLFS